MERSAFSSLTLPSFGPDVPGLLTVRDTTGTSAAFAEQLLDAGVLESSDWQGDGLDEAIARGIERWVCQWPGGRASVKLPRWRFFDLSVMVTSDLEGTHGNYSDYYAMGDCTHYGFGNPAPVGAIGLILEHWTEAVVGKTVRRMEKRCPAAGYALLNVAQIALMRTIGCGGPAWTYDYLFEYGDHGYGDDEAAEENGYPSFTAAERDLPREARIFNSIDSLSLKAAAAMQWRGGLKEALRAALELESLLDVEGPCGLEGVLGPAFLPVRVCWTKGDIVEQTFDRYGDALSECGEGTDMLYLRGFQPCLAHALTAEGAAEAVLRIVRILDLCDVILYGLADKALMITTDYDPAMDDGPEGLQAQVQQRIRV